MTRKQKTFILSAVGTLGVIACVVNEIGPKQVPDPPDGLSLLCLIVAEIAIVGLAAIAMRRDSEPELSSASSARHEQALKLGIGE